MGGWTNRGKYRVLDIALRGAAPPSNLYVALCTAANAPTADTNTKGELTEIANGNGYTTGGVSIGLDDTDFDSLVENDTDDRAELQIRNIVWTASSGPIPSSGNGARWAILTDDNGTQGNREVWFYWDLTSDHSISDGQTFTLEDLTMRLREPS